MCFNLNTKEHKYERSNACILINIKQTLKTSDIKCPERTRTILYVKKCLIFVICLNIYIKNILDTNLEINTLAL